MLIKAVLSLSHCAEVYYCCTLELWGISVRELYALCLYTELKNVQAGKMFISFCLNESTSPAIVTGAKWGDKFGETYSWGDYLFREQGRGLIYVGLQIAKAARLFVLFKKHRQLLRCLC